MLRNSVDGVVPVQSRPLIPFLKEPWTSRSKYPAILFETFLYGVYVVLFGSYCFTFIRRKLVLRTPQFATVALFVLATGDIIITIFFFFRFVLRTLPLATITSSHQPEPWNKTLEYKFGLYVVSNAISSALLINRCYTLWRNRRILIAPVSLVVASTVISFVSISASQFGDHLLATGFITSAAANLSVSLLIGVRIWWTTRKARSILDTGFAGVNKLIVSLIIDSGALYSLSIFLYLVFHTLVLDASLTQIAGVAITGMVMRTLQKEAYLDGNTTNPNTTTHRESHNAMPSRSRIAYRPVEYFRTPPMRSVGLSVNARLHRNDGNGVSDGIDSLK